METLNLLKKLVNIPSGFPNEKKLALFLDNYLKNLGFQVEKVFSGKNRPNLIATFGKSTKYLGFYGHMDTIPPDSNYPQNPFQVIIKNSKAHGLGVADMKGGIAAILRLGHYAVKNNLPVKLIFGVDEENISQGAHDVIDSGLLSDVSFLIVGESGQAATSKQAYSVCYGRKGRMLFSLSIQGKKAHAAEAEAGINAIEEGAEVIKIIQSLAFPIHKRLGKTSIIIHSFHGETDSFSIPERSTITFSLLTTPNIKSSDVIDTLQTLTKKAGLNITIEKVVRKTPYAESYEVDTDNTFIKILEREIFIKDKIQPLYTTSVADENVFANRLHIPVITVGPVGGGDHTIHEWLNIDSLEKTTITYCEILRLFTNSS